jgi:hypothetical protein
MGSAMFARFVYRQFPYAVGRDTHAALFPSVRALLHAWGMERPGQRTWKLAPHFEGVGGVEARLQLHDEGDDDALAALERLARAADFDLLLAHEPATPAAAWIGAAPPRTAATR